MNQDESEIVVCEACEDTGWQTFSCRGWTQAICGRRKMHLPHDFAKPCPCRAMNRNYQDRLQAQRRIAS